MKFSSHGTYIRPSSVVAMAVIPDAPDFGNELSHAQAEDKQNDEAGFKIVHARRRTLRADATDEVQKGSDHQQRAAEESAPFETGQAALFGEAVKFRQPGQREKHDDEETRRRKPAGCWKIKP